MAVRSRGTQANVGGEPNILAKPLLESAYLTGGKGPINAPFGASARNAKEQEGVHAGAQVGLDLPQ